MKKGVSSEEEAMPGAVIAVQTFGDFLNFNPHLHIIATDGCFINDGIFMNGITPNASDLEIPFRREVLDMLKHDGKITDAVVDNMDSWQHSGFHVYCGNSIMTDDEEGLENLAKYIVRAPISQERMLYIPSTEAGSGVPQIIYTGKNSRVEERFTALDWLARLVTHIPNRGDQLVQYYGYYSNKSRGMRKKAEDQNINAEKTDMGTETSNTIPCLVESDILRKAFRKSWARLIQKVYNTDPLLCPKCNGVMRIIAFIEEEAVIKKILTHLNLWLPGHDPPENSKLSQKTQFSNILDIDFNDISHKPRQDSILHMPYEDEYSQAGHSAPLHCSPMQPERRLMMIIPNRACKAQGKSVDIRVCSMMPLVLAYALRKGFLGINQVKRSDLFIIFSVYDVNITVNSGIILQF